MARGVNKVILVGNLGGDPDVRYLPSGGAVTNITIATSESWKNKETGNQEERTEWHKVVFFGRLGEIAGQYLKKGAKVYVEGQLRTRKWQDNSGQDRYTTEVVAGEMQMLDSQGGNAGGQKAQQQYAAYQGQQAPDPAHQQQQGAQRSGMNANGSKKSPHAQPAPQSNGFDDFDDDIPFANPYKHMEYLV